MRFQPTVPLLVNNVELLGPSGVVSVDLFLDTGAEVTVIAPAVLELIGYDIHAIRSFKQILTANGPVSVPRTIVNSISLGNLTLRRFEVIAHEISLGAEVQGLLGMNFLKHFRTVVDFPRGYLEIRRS